VVTVCEKEAADRCPIFPGHGKRIQWAFTDPAKVQGTEDEKLEKIRAIREEIKEAVKQFINENAVI
jgi:arsenate reductase